MVAEVEGLHEAEKLVEKYLRNMTASEVKDEISYYRSTLSSSVPKMLFAGQLIALLSSFSLSWFRNLCVPTAASRTPPWLASGLGCRCRRLSRG